MCENWIELAHDCAQYRAVASAVLNLQVFMVTHPAQ
jgi:hypothetical protein